MGNVMMIYLAEIVIGKSNQTMVPHVFMIVHTTARFAYYRNALRARSQCLVFKLL